MANRLRLVNIVVAGIGVLVAAYLTYIHYAGIEPICAGDGGGCAKVQGSVWATFAGVPVATLGLVGYVGLLVAAVLDGELPRLAGAVFGLVGAGFSGYLTYLELFEIYAICQWCVASAILMLILAVVTTARMVRGR